VNAKIAVLENETIERALVAVCRHDVWDKAQERLLGCRSNRTHGVIVILPPDHVAYVPDCCFYLGREKRNAELACRSNGNRERFRFLFKEAFAEPSSSEVEREIKVEQ
jgi:hypothetical protein